MPVYRKIYYEKASGQILHHQSFDNDNYVRVTFEQDYQAIISLNSRAFDTIGLVEFERDNFDQDFAESNGNRVNPETLELEFSYPDPNNPEAPQEFVKPLTEQIEEVRNDMDTAILELTMVIAMQGGNM